VTGEAKVGLGGTGVNAGSHCPAAYAATKRFQSYSSDFSSVEGESKSCMDPGGERDDEGR
jgi:hypothetical protein